MSDGCVVDGRFDLFTKSKEYAIYVCDVLNQITGVKAKYYLKKDKRKISYWGYRVYTNRHVYFAKLEEIFYEDRKRLNTYICNRLDIESIAHAYICDGTIEHNINPASKSIQNIAYIFLLKYPKEELDILLIKLNKLDIRPRLVTKPSAHGYKYYLKFSGLELQKFISKIYQYIPEDFKYKTKLYYKTLSKVDVSLPNTERFIVIYNKPEDIVRHSWEQEIPK